MDVETQDFLRTTLRIMAQNGSPFEPAISCNKPLKIVSNFCAFEAPRIGNRTNLCVDLVPSATDALDQKALQHIQAAVAHLLAFLTEVISCLVQLIALLVQYDRFLTRRFARPGTVGLGALEHYLVDVLPHP